MLSKYYSGLIYDVLRYDLGYNENCVLSDGIKPLWNCGNIFGRAFTVKGRRLKNGETPDESVRLKMLSLIPRDCVMVYKTDYYDVAHFGDITATVAQKAGCKGAIIDGNTRDASSLEKIGFPTFCRSITPISSYGQWQVESFDVEIFLMGPSGIVTIHPEDYIFADRDGVIVVPYKMVLPLVSRIPQRMSAENDLKNTIITGINVNLEEEYRKRDIT